MPKKIVAEDIPPPHPLPTKDSPDKPEHPPCEEIGGVKAPEPTRYGDWEKNGRCIDF